MEIRGSCECGEVTFSVNGPLSPTFACHCSQCRKTSGHYWAATEVPSTHLRLIKDSGLKWYRSSDQARRGFCVSCGSSLFWEADGEGTTSIGTGTLDDLPNGATTVVKHIFMANKGTYYDVADGLPQSESW
jgi:hypothetical protein